MVSISRAWYNGSYTMAAKLIKSLESHYKMIQFLIIHDISPLQISKVVKFYCHISNSLVVIYLQAPENELNLGLDKVTVQKDIYFNTVLASGKLVPDVYDITSTSNWIAAPHISNTLDLSGLMFTRRRIESDRDRNWKWVQGA